MEELTISQQLKYQINLTDLRRIPKWTKKHWYMLINVN